MRISSNSIEILEISELRINSTNIEIIEIIVIETIDLQINSTILEIIEIRINSNIIEIIEILETLQNQLKVSNYALIQKML